MTDEAEERLEAIVGMLRNMGTDVERIEVKESVEKLPGSMIETLSSFSNGSGGTVILGLAEKNGFKPVEGFRAKRIADSVAGACSDKMTPPVRASISIVPFEGASVVVAEVAEMSPRDKPCYVTERGMYRGSYIRSFDGDRHLSAYEVDRLLEDRVQPANDAEIVQDASMHDLDAVLVSGLLRRQRELRPRIFSSLSDEDALQDLMVAACDADGILRPTLGGLLALGTYPQKYFPRLTVTFAAYKGVDKAMLDGEKFLDSEKMIGPIPLVIQDTVAAVRRNMRVGGVLEEGLRRDVPDYPPDAVREAVCNALMHRDYSQLGRGFQVQVNLYADRLEVMSPGGLYGVVTVDTIGKPGYSSTRNQHLADILETTPYEGGYVAENRGTGFQLIEALLDDAGMDAPIVIDKVSMFTITFTRRMTVAQDAGADDDIVRFLGTHGQSTSPQIAQALSMPRSTVNYRLAKLIDSGRVLRIGLPRSRNQSYRLRHGNTIF